MEVGIVRLTLMMVGDLESEMRTVWSVSDASAFVLIPSDLKVKDVV